MDRAAATTSPPNRGVSRRRILFAALFGLGLLSVGASARPNAAATLENQRPPVDAGHSGPLDIGFVPNRGQWPAELRYRLSGDRSTLLLLDDGLIELPRDAGAPAWRLRFVTGAATRLLPGARRPGQLSFLIGNDRSHWAAKLPQFESVAWQDLAPGLDLRLASDQGTLRVQALRTRPRATGARQADAAPWTWERIDPASAARRPELARQPALAQALQAAWRDAAEPDAAGLGARSDGRAFRPGLPGIVRRPGLDLPLAPNQADAQLAWSSYLGGGGSELARGLAVDATGHAYVAGSTSSANLPTQAPLQPELGNGGSLQDAFVAKIAPDGQRLVWATYLGGNRQDEALDIAIDAEGRAHLTGYTQSPDFPMEQPIQPRVNLSDGIFSGDAFASKLSADGSRLEWSTPLGGTARDIGKGIAVDAEGFVYVTGWTGSNFPAVKALHPLNRGVTDAFVVKIVPAGDDVVYSTHLGGSVEDLGRDIAVDAAGRAYIIGTTQSVNFQVSEPFQRANAGGRDAFIARFASDGQAVDWATYLGGRGDDYGIGIAVGEDGAVTVVGRSDSPNFPREQAFQNSRLGTSDLFVSRLGPDGDSLIYSSYLGGNGVEGDCAEVDAPRTPSTPTPAPGVPRLPEGSKFPDGPIAALALDGAGRAYISTCTSSSNAPLARALQRSRVGRFSAYLAVLDPAGDALALGSYLGGQGIDVPRAVAVGADGGIYLAGQTTSTDFPTAPMPPLQASRSGTDDAFALKIAPIFEAPTATPAPPEPSQEPSPTARPSQTPTVTPPTGSPSPTSEPSPSASMTPTAPPETGQLWLPWLGHSAPR